MNSIPNGNYALALSILNSVVGIRFGELQAAQTADVQDVAEICKLKRRFEHAYAQREALPDADNAALEVIIDTLSQEVRTKLQVHSGAPTNGKA